MSKPTEVEIVSIKYANDIPFNVVIWEVTNGYQGYKGEDGRHRGWQSL